MSGKSKRCNLYELACKAYAEKRRLVAPLAGFPGCDILGVSIKVAQQNYGMHYNCIEALVKLLKPDAAFMMMDLSVEANALGLPVRFPIDESSSVEKHPVEQLSDLEEYRRVNILQDSRIQSYIQTVELMSIGLPKEVLIGAYVIGPVTLAGLLQSAEKTALDSILDTEHLDKLCRFATGIIQEYAHALINAGADIICILEPTGAILGPEQFRRFSTKYVRGILESYQYSGVETVYHVCGNTMHLVKPMTEAGVAGISLDSPETGVNLAKAAQMIPENVVVIGNVNPTKALKDGSVETVRTATCELLESMREFPNFILSTGCDLPPGTPVENMLAFMEAGRNFK